jgi:hypothetical protein
MLGGADKIVATTDLIKNGFTVLYPSFTNHADMKKAYL